MESREHDLRTKIETLRQLLDGGADPEALFRAAESTALALEFRATDSMIGLNQVPPDLVSEA